MDRPCRRTLFNCITSEAHPASITPTYDGRARAAPSSVPPSLRPPPFPPFQPWRNWCLGPPCRHPRRSTPLASDDLWNGRASRPCRLQERQDGQRRLWRSLPAVSRRPSGPWPTEPCWYRYPTSSFRVAKLFSRVRFKLSCWTRVACCRSAKPGSLPTAHCSAAARLDRPPGPAAPPRT